MKKRERERERDSDREKTLKGGTERGNIRYRETNRKSLIKYIGCIVSNVVSVLASDGGKLETW